VDTKESNKKPDQDQHVDEELENLLKEVQEPLPGASHTPAPLTGPAPLTEPAPTTPVEIVPTAAIPGQEPEQEDISNDIKIILKKFHDVTDRILHNFACDRDEVGDTIERLRDMMINTRKPPEFVVMGLVSALKTKADTNSNIIKLLDAFAKIISSTKNTNIMQQNMTVDLSDLLNDEP